MAPTVWGEARPWCVGLRNPLYDSHAVSHCHMTGSMLFSLSTVIIPFESTPTSWRPAPPAPVLEQPSDAMNVCPWLPKTELDIVAWRWKGAIADCVFLMVSAVQSMVAASLVFALRK